MDWSDVVLLLLVVAIFVLYIRLMLKNKRLRQMADESECLRREAEATEQRNRQLKQEMTSNISHELKTPVSSIRGYLEILLSDKPVDDERRRFFLDRCYRQTLRLSDLIQDVSVINKLEESSDLFPRTDVDACIVADEALADLVDKADAAGITMHNNLPSMPMQGNHELIYCIFRNLMENSVSYAGEGIDIVLESYKESADHYFIHYYDTGKGVADEYLSRLFDRFVRIDSGRSRQNGGTGLGLSIVKHAVLFHGGEIYAKNRTAGGLEFFFSLKKQ
jgi:two-component system phosphate regulon sensor histidine kinase PhoR